MKTKQGLLWGCAAGLGAGIALRRWRAAPRVHLEGKVALITGASRGLGLQLARELAHKGCRLAICARDPEELQRARADLAARGAEVFAQECDIADRRQVDRLCEAVTAHYGAVDVLINNAGIIQVGPITEQTLDDFKQAMEVMFWGPLYTTMALLPDMLGRGAGHIVNITSIGGKVAVPHMLPYCAAKFALVGLSEGLYTELRPRGIHVLTVVPGLMRTGSHYRALFKGRQAEEYRWFALSATMPGVAMNAARAARQIVTGLERQERERILGLPAKAAVGIHNAAPEVMARILATIEALVLPPAGGSKQLIPGKEAARKLHSRAHALATSLGKKAAVELNQLPAGGLP